MTSKKYYYFIAIVFIHAMHHAEMPTETGTLDFHSSILHEHTIEHSKKEQLALEHDKYLQQQNDPTTTTQTIDTGLTSQLGIHNDFQDHEKEAGSLINPPSEKSTPSSSFKIDKTTPEKESSLQSKDFKDGIKSEVLQDTSEKDSLDMQKIKTGIEKLPKNKQPQNINDALNLIQRGQKVFDFIENEQPFQAVRLNLPPLVKGEHIAHDKTILKNAFSKSDDDFWNLIKDNTIIKKSIESHSVPFTKESLQDVAYNMYFKDVYIRKNLKGSEALSSYKKAYQKSIIQLQWNLFGRSIQQDQAFTSGMITFHDPDFKFFKFLDGYAELISPKYKLYTGTALHSLTTTGAYTRESSHWNGQKGLSGKNFGIDIKNNLNQKDEALPAYKSHILFGTRTNGMTFVKWEEYGVTVNPLQGDTSALEHTLSYFKKKDKEDNPATERREKVPSEVEKKFKELYNKKLNNVYAYAIHVHGISAMLEILEKEAPKKVATFKTFLTTTMKYQPETLHVRKGSEIILGKSHGFSTP